MTSSCRTSSGQSPRIESSQSPRIDASHSPRIDPSQSYPWGLAGVHPWRLAGVDRWSFSNTYIPESIRGDLNVQSAYKRQNTGAGKSHFLHFLEVARQDALTKWRPNHQPPCLRYFHTFYRVFAVQASCSGSNIIVTLTEMLLCLRGGRQTEQHRSRPCSCSAG